MCSCGGAECALCWSLSASTPHIPTNVSLCVPALYGMAVASRRVIGYRADCFACRPFFHPFVVSFSEPPTSPPLLSPQLLFSRTWTHNTHSRVKTLAHTSLQHFHSGHFRADCCATFFKSIHTNGRALCKSHLNSHNSVSSQAGKSHFSCLAT